jgi:hypothetical protein
MEPTSVQNLLISLRFAGIVSQIFQLKSLIGFVSCGIVTSYRTSVMTSFLCPISLTISAEKLVCSRNVIILKSNFIYFYAKCLTTLSVQRIHSVDDRMINEYGAVCGMRIGRGNRKTLMKPAPVSPQVSYALPWDRTRVTEVRGWKLSA